MSRCWIFYWRINEQRSRGSRAHVLRNDNFVFRPQILSAILPRFSRRDGRAAEGAPLLREYGA